MPHSICLLACLPGPHWPETQSRIHRETNQLKTTQSSLLPLAMSKRKPSNPLAVCDPETPLSTLERWALIPKAGSWAQISCKKACRLCANGVQREANHAGKCRTSLNNKERLHQLRNADATQEVKETAPAAAASSVAAIAAAPPFDWDVHETSIKLHHSKSQAR